MDYSIGVYVIDRFTYYALEFLETVDQNSKKTINDLVSSFYL
jgi:phosphatidylinositol glycan class K